MITIRKKSRGGTAAMRIMLIGFLMFRSGPAAPGPLPAAETDMSYLDNGEVRIGFALSLGGAVTFLSSPDHPGNLINSADLGRQIQMSHYSGPHPFIVGDKKPMPHWEGLGWNPIQTGDCHMNPSRVEEYRNDGKEMYIRCIPMQWPLENVPGDCTFETWTTLDGPMVHMRFRCTNRREDKTDYGPHAQELPAVYTVSKLSRLMSYTGEFPFTGDTLTHVTNNWREGWPWTRFTATERWAALVDESGFGVGVFKDDGGEFHGGVHGDVISDDPMHASTAYVAPIHRENFDYNITYEHRTTLMVGKLPEIRGRFCAMATKSPPRWEFEEDRRHWTLVNAADQGLPFDGAWRIRLDDREARLDGPTHCWRAGDAPRIVIEAAWSGGPARGRLSWKRHDDDRLDAEKQVTFELIPGGGTREYEIDLSVAPGYKGLITGLRLRPPGNPASGDTLTIRSIGLEPAEGE